MDDDDDGDEDDNDEDDDGDGDDATITTTIVKTMMPLTRCMFMLVSVLLCVTDSSV
jgi:hypothetical protein